MELFIYVIIGIVWLVIVLFFMPAYLRWVFEDKGKSLIIHLKHYNRYFNWDWRCDELF